MTYQRRIFGGLLGAALLAGAVGTPLIAAPSDVMKTRIAGFREIGTGFKNINDQLKADTPQLFLIQISARELQTMARQIKGWFPAGSGPKPGVKTAAKPEIWKQAKQFNAARDAFVAKADALAAATKGGDVAAIQLEAKALGQTCSSCHKAFRAETKG